MKTLLRSTTAYRAVAQEAAAGEQFQASLVLFPDGKYLRTLLKECAKAFFSAADGSRIADLIDRESFSDCLFFPAEGGKLSADDCGHIVEEEMLLPVESEKKLFVLDGFQNATPLVQNKLLKSLEEPPRGVCFLLGASEEHAILPTVLSRVKKYAVPPFSEEQIKAALERNYGASETVAASAAASGGIYSLGEELVSGGGEEFRLAERFLSLEDTEAFCRSMADHREKAGFFAAAKSLLRDALFVSAGQGKYARRGAERLARLYPTGAALRALELVGEAEKQVRFNANFAGCLLTLAMEIREEKVKWQKLS